MASPLALVIGLSVSLRADSTNLVAMPVATNHASGSPVVVEKNSTNPTNAVSSGASRLEYSAFQVISDRNVFNANRSSRTARTGERPARRPPAETISLVGALSSAKGDVAFFDGTSSQFRKALKIGDTIAGHKLVAISPDIVQLEIGDQKVILKLGAQLRREDQGAWQLATGSSTGDAARTLSSSSTNTASAETPEPSESTADAGSTGEVSDALKRLMQKREQEFKNENP